MERKKWKLSSFTNIISLQDFNYTALYNALTMEVVTVRDDVFRKIKLHNIQDQEIIQKLFDARIIIFSDEEDNEYLQRAKKFFDKDILGVLCLMLTDSCNLRCRYCFVEHQFPEEYNFNFLSSEMAKKGINLFVKHLPKSLRNGLKEPTISFYGGEPLLNISTLESSLAYIDQLKNTGKIPENVFLTINTNATVISPKIAKLLSNYNVSASVSLDGVQEVHNKARKSREGKGTFKKVINGIEMLRDYGVDVGISCAVAMHNLEYLEENARMFLDEIEVDVFGFNFLLEGGLEEPNFKLSDYANELAKKMVKCYQIAREKEKQEERSFRLARAFAMGEINYYDCSACGQQLVMDPRGRLGTCHAYIHSDENFIEYNPEINLFSHPLWQKWKKRSPIQMDQCQDCIALGVCGGGCPYNAEIRKGDIWELDESYCPFARSMIKFLIKDLVKKTIS